MLHMIIQSSENETKLKLEGALAGNSVDELRALWERIRAVSLHEGMLVDVTGLSSMDNEGKRLLLAMGEIGTRLVVPHALSSSR